MQAAKIHRTYSNSVDTIRPAHLQPRRWSGIGATGTCRDKHPDPPLEPSHGEVQRSLAGRIQPLHIIQGDEHRRVRCEALDHRQEGRPQNTFVGGGAFAGLFEQSVYGNPLHRGAARPARPTRYRRKDRPTPQNSARPQPTPPAPTPPGIHRATPARRRPATTLSCRYPAHPRSPSLKPAALPTSKSRRPPRIHTVFCSLKVPPANTSVTAIRYRESIAPACPAHLSRTILLPRSLMTCALFQGIVGAANDCAGRRR